MKEGGRLASPNSSIDEEGGLLYSVIVRSLPVILNEMKNLDPSLTLRMTLLKRADMKKLFWGRSKLALLYNSSANLLLSTPSTIPKRNRAGNNNI